MLRDPSRAATCRPLQRSYVSCSSVLWLTEIVIFDRRLHVLSSEVAEARHQRT